MSDRRSNHFFSSTKVFQILYLATPLTVFTYISDGGEVMLGNNNGLSHHFEGGVPHVIEVIVPNSPRHRSGTWKDILYRAKKVQPSIGTGAANWEPNMKALNICIGTVSWALHSRTWLLYWSVSSIISIKYKLRVLFTPLRLSSIDCSENYGRKGGICDTS